MVVVLQMVVGVVLVCLGKRMKKEGVYIFDMLTEDK